MRDLPPELQPGQVVQVHASGEAITIHGVLDGGGVLYGYVTGKPRIQEHYRTLYPALLTRHPEAWTAAGSADDG